MGLIRNNAVCWKFDSITSILVGLFIIEGKADESFTGKRFCPDEIIVSKEGGIKALYHGGFIMVINSSKCWLLYELYLADEMKIEKDCK